MCRAEPAAVGEDLRVQHAGRLEEGLRWPEWRRAEHLGRRSTFGASVCLLQQAQKLGKDSLVESQRVLDSLHSAGTGDVHDPRSRDADIARDQDAIE